MACIVRNVHKRETYTHLQKTRSRATQTLVSTSLNKFLGSRLCAQPFIKNSCVAASLCKVKKRTLQPSKINVKNLHKPTVQKKTIHQVPSKNSIPKLHAFALRVALMSNAFRVQPSPPVIVSN